MITAEFRADTEAQTITGLIVPFDVVGTSSSGAKWKFPKGSITWDDPQRVTTPLNLHHEHHNTVGHVRVLMETDAGIEGVIKIDDADVFARVDRGELTSFSAEVRIDAHDAYRAGDTWVAKRAHVTAVALTSSPAFIEAKVRETVGAAFERQHIEFTEGFALVGARAGSLPLGDVATLRAHQRPARMPGEVSMRMRSEGAPSGWSPEREQEYRQRRAAEIKAAQREREQEEQREREAMDQAARDLAVEVNLSAEHKAAWRSLSRSERDAWHQMPATEQTAALQARVSVLEAQRERHREHQRALAFQAQQSEQAQRQAEAEQASQPHRRGWLRRKSGEGVSE